MGLTDTQEQIAETIVDNCPGWDPFVTVSDIAEETGFSEQTIHNNIDKVIQARGDIGTRQVGQANVYFHRKNRLEDIKTEDWVAVGSLARLGGEATYYELREAPEDCDFDLIAHYYDASANEIDGYFPKQREIGQIVQGYGSDPISIKLWDHDEVLEEEVSD